MVFESKLFKNDGTIGCGSACGESLQKNETIFLELDNK